MEKEQKKKNPKRYIGGVVAGAVIAFSVMVLNKIFTAQNASDVMMAICNGFFVSGVLLAGIAGLLFSGNGGTFDMLAYGLRQVGRMFVPGKRGDEKAKQTFYDYRKARMERPKAVRYLLLPGVGYLLLAGVFLAIYYGV